MATIAQIDVSKLSLDLKNFRTVPQKNEKDAIKAMISIKAERFFAVLESIISDGYLLTENIILLQDGEKYIVKEGNRRVAALKLIHGLHKIAYFNLPTSIAENIKKLDATWKKENTKVPCTIFSAKEIDKVDRVVSLAHGKGEKASRDPWNSVARARHNRDINKIAEPSLDLLEKYLKKGNNINNQQKERWGGEYPLTILDEVLRKIYARLSLTNAAEIAKKYPQIGKRDEIENILRDIGLELITFATVRQPNFAEAYGIPPLPENSGNSGTSSSTPANNTASNTQAGSASGTTSSDANPSQNSGSTGSNNGSTSSTSSNSGGSQPTATNTRKAHSINDPKYVASLLRKFNPRGNNRQKVVTLRDEIKKLKIEQNPIAFCFLLRSMFEISSKAYCLDHSISTTKSGGREKTLVELLRSATDHLTNGNTNTAKIKVLHGAMTEISKSDGILSVTSMNQLVHNPSFSVVSSDICAIFSNVYPLLEEMN